LDIVPESAATKDAPARKGDAVFLAPDMFMQQNDPYFKTNGFFERSIVKRVEEFGNLVEVWSTKESRDAKDDAQPSSRGKKGGLPRRRSPDEEETKRHSW
jgi:hypothetical protein